MTLGFASAATLLRRRSPRTIAVPPWLFTDQMASFVAQQLGVSPYPDKLPSRNTSYPLISFTVISGNNFLTLRGATTLEQMQIQFDVWSPSSFATGQLSKQLYNLLQDLRGMMGLVKVTNCFGETPRSGYTPSAVGSDLGLYRASRDFTFQFYN